MRDSLIKNQNNIRPTEGDVVVNKVDKRNRRKWKFAVTEQLYPWCDVIVRSVRVRCGKNQLEKAFIPTRVTMWHELTKGKQATDQHQKIKI